MATDHIRYDLLAQQALRGVVRNVLADAAKNGLPGEHHFYISFNTTAPGVRLSPRLMEQYPQEMTVILQHQFWDLKVSADGFEVGLSFGGVPERVGVPFDAIKGFFDPSVQFGLQFETEPGEAVAAEPNAATPSPPVALTPAKEPRPRLVEPAPPASPDKEPEEDSSQGAEVVRLDRFRKPENRGRTNDDGTKGR